VWEDNANTQDSTRNIVEDYLSRAIPVGAVVIDSPWETHYNTLKWDASRYPNPQGLVNTLHSDGVRVVVWITGFVNRESPDYANVVSSGYAVNNGQDFTWWKGTGVHIDFTKASAKNWWHGRMDGLLNIGIDGWKVDNSAHRVSDPVVTSMGSIPRLDFKKYYAADFYDYTRTKGPKGVIMVRPYSAAQGGFGSSVSKCAVGWVGDHKGGFSGIGTQLSDVYTSAQAGYSMVGVEVGGYVKDSPPSKRSLIRYAQFAALTPLMENGGQNGGLAQHLPWYWDAQTTDIYRYFATLHSELAPYTFSYGVEAHLTGTPIIRKSDKMNAHHLLGRELFISVLKSDVTSKSVKFPAGSSWIDYWDEGKAYAGGTNTAYTAPLERFPVFIKAGAIIPMDVETSVTGHGDAGSKGKVTVNVYPYLSTSLKFHRPTGDGTGYEDVTISSNESSRTVQVSGPASRAYLLRVKSFARPTSVANADSWSYDAAGKRVIIAKTGASFIITINGLAGYSGIIP
jgi:alpha-glucosidase (family GH31 glycosyl hydrolase)